MPEVAESAPRPIVLVVEDDLLQRIYASSILEDAGFEVVEAANANEAILILEARKDIRVVFTDIEMPGSIDGLKLARAIRDRWPPIELILTSGRHRLGADAIPARGRFLAKPYEPDVLIAVISAFAAGDRRQL
ncbi:MAG TPA: response regulator [Pseudolabrys sp.]|jgi:CheY-like chemotaxis protein